MNDMDWFENEEFWEKMYPFLFPAERVEKAPQELEQIFSLLDGPVRTVLDLCCGPGRHSIALAHLGLRVTGVDRSAYYLDKARARAAGEKVEVEWIQSDMRDFVRAQSFDLVLSMFTSFGYFSDHDDDVKVLRNIHHSLVPGGVMVMDVAGKEWIAENFQATALTKLPDGSRLVQHREISDGWSKINNEWILISGEKAKSFRFSHTVYSGRELSDRIIQAGFGRVRLYGDLSGSEFGPGCERLIAVAGK
jgi:SAM-dependent methyltransferase